VHASAQVVHFETLVERPDSAWVRGVNTHLAEGAAVLWSKPVDAEFHARFSARARTYRYRLLNRPVRPGLGAQYFGWFHLPLDVEAMRAGAAMLVGQHDFSAFRSSECQAKTPVRTIHALEIVKHDDQIHFILRANAFLHHMVRNIVGTLVYVGKGKHKPSWMKEVLESRERSKAAPTFGPEGLILERIEYEAKWKLPA
jgi:tRNA pseudouridine38-40 synthase